MTAAWRRFVAAFPLTIALLCIALVAFGGWVWSFEEQSRRAEALGFALPWMLPLVLDGLALSLAGVAFAAALDGRPAVSARLGTAIAVLTSAGSNAEAAWARSDGKPTTVAIASIVPIAANLAFEVFLGELRRQVHRQRGQAAPVAVPAPRLVRLMLSPIQTSMEWRTYVLAATALTARSITDQSARPAPTRNVGPAERPRLPAGPAVAATVASPPRSAVAVPKGATPSATPQSAKAPTVTTPTRPVAVPDLPVASMKAPQQVAWLAREVKRHPDRTVAEWAALLGCAERTADRRLAHARESATDGDATPERVLEESTA